MAKSVSNIITAKVCFTKSYGKSLPKYQGQRFFQNITAKVYLNSTAEARYFTLEVICAVELNMTAGDLGYVHTGTISYRYRTGLIFGTEKLTVHTGPVRYRTSFGTCSHGYAIVPFSNISRQNKQKKSDMSTNFKHCRIRSNLYLKFNKHEKK